MKLFLLTFFSVYGGMHAYAFFRARSAVAFGPGTGAALAVFMLAMTLAPVLVRVLEQYEFELAGRILAYVAYLWMGILFLFFSVSILVNFANLVLRIAGWATGSDATYVLSARPSFFIAAGLAFGIALYGYFSALDIRTERLRIETAKLPAGIDRLTIVQISDVHLGLIVRRDRLRKIMAIVKREKPDIFISTGDLVDAQINHMTGMAELLREVCAPYGNYAITGNHEYYAGIKQALEFTRTAGFTLLRGEAAKNGVINIAGVNDPAGLQLNIDKAQSETSLLSALPNDRFTLLLKHRPVVDGASSRLFDLQLSGHTHRGQIFPFTYLSKLVFPLNSGRFDLLSRSILYVSRGTGTWGPPIRFLSPPEITVIELARKK